MIRPINSALSCQVVTKRLNKNKLKSALPVVATPLVAYLSNGGRETERNKIIAKESTHIAQPVTNRTEYNTDKLKECGVSDSDIKKYLKYDGSPNDDGKAILKAHNKSFKGTSDDSSTSDTTTDLDVSDDIITDSVKDFVSDALPVYNAARVIQKVCEGDEEEIVKQSVV